MTRIVVGMYDRIDDAKRAIDALVSEGFPREDISMVASDAQGEYSKQLSTKKGEDAMEGAATGAGVGAVLGGLGGLLVGLGALAIPGIGPVLAAGPLISALAGAGIGAAAGGLLGALVDLGIPEEQAKVYAEGVRHGGTLVTAQVPDDRANEAVAIMNRFNPIDIDRRSSEWGTNQMATERQAQPMNTTRTGTPGEGDTFEVVEEDLAVGKRQVDEGGVRVNTTVTEKPVEETVNLRKEHVDVERRPVDRPASPRDLDTFEEGTMEVTATSEEPVVEKRARVVEEVEIHKDVQQQQETIRDTVRRKDVNVEPIGNTEVGGFDEYEPMFRNHFQTSYSQTGERYEVMQPGYTYGYRLANDPRFRGRNWSDIEMDARRDWEATNPNSPWENFKDAVRNAWETVTGTR